MCEPPRPYIPATGVARVDMTYLVLGETAMNVIHFFMLGGWNTDQLNELAAAVKVAHTDNLKPHQSESASLERINCTDLTTQTGPSIEYTTGLPVIGSIGNAVANTMQTVATKFGTAGRGRSKRGRAYWVGVPDNAVVLNKITSTYAGQISNAWNDFFNDVSVAIDGAFGVVVSYCQNKVWLENADITVITHFSTEVYVDSQRRRGPGRGI